MITNGDAKVNHVKPVLPAEIESGNDIDNPTKSDLQLWEDERPLGPAHAKHNRIRNAGTGAYSHWGRRSYFPSAIAEAPPASGLIYRTKSSGASIGSHEGTTESELACRDLSSVSHDGERAAETSLNVVATKCASRVELAATEQG